MKGKISDRLRHILGNRESRSQLRKQLIQGNGGAINVDGKVYRIRTERPATARDLGSQTSTKRSSGR